MRHIAVILVIAGAILASVLPLVAAFANPQHESVTLCHWVPAHGGSFITITVDDDGSSGNGPLQAHLAHENDIIPGVLNWTVDTKAIWRNGCVAVATTPEPTIGVPVCEPAYICASATTTPTPTPSPTLTPTLDVLTSDIGDPVFVTPRSLPAAGLRTSGGFDAPWYVHAIVGVGIVGLIAAAFLLRGKTG